MSKISKSKSEAVLRNVRLLKSLKMNLRTSSDKISPV